MTAKKVKENNKLLLENLNVGDKILDLHAEEIEVTDDLIEQMRAFEMDTKRSAIWRDKVTGSFFYFKYFEDHPEEKNKPKKKAGKKPKAEDLDEEIESEAESEEDLMLDCIADYKDEFGVKKVNTNTKKFKAYFEEWKKIE